MPINNIKDFILLLEVIVNRCQRMKKYGKLVMCTWKLCHSVQSLRNCKLFPHPNPYIHKSIKYASCLQHKDIHYYLFFFIQPRVRWRKEKISHKTFKLFLYIYLYVWLELFFVFLFVFYVVDSIENALCTHQECNKNENNKYNAMKFVKHKKRRNVVFDIKQI